MTKHEQIAADLIWEFSRLGFDLETDNFGQIVIYTGMKFGDKDGTIVPMKEEDGN